MAKAKRYRQYEIAEEFADTGEQMVLATDAERLEAAISRKDAALRRWQEAWKSGDSVKRAQAYAAARAALEEDYDG